MKISERYSRNLPHIQPEGAIYFVTFRLYGSIPKIKLEQLKEKFDLEKLQSRKDEATIKTLTQKYKNEKESLLEQINDGPQYLSIPEIAHVLIEQIHKYDNIYFELICYCIMSNHVHIILDASIQLNNGTNYVPLFKILKLIKGTSANYSNKILNRTGSFWMNESWDHFIRDDKELDNIHCYILENPVKAKLVSRWRDWANTYAKYPPE